MGTRPGRGWAIVATLTCTLGCVEVPEITVAEEDATRATDAQGMNIDDPDARAPVATGDSAVGVADAAREPSGRPDTGTGPPPDVRPDSGTGPPPDVRPDSGTGPPPDAQTDAENGRLDARIEDAASAPDVGPVDMGPDCDITLRAPADRGDVALAESTFEWNQPCPARVRVYICPERAPCPEDWLCVSNRITDTAGYSGGQGEGARGHFDCQAGGMVPNRVYFWTVGSPWTLPGFRSFTAR